jgi:hypothetical protein
MELLELVEAIADDPVRTREIAETRAMWARLKRPWAAKSAQD